jgi:hypothetical protein
LQGSTAAVFDEAAPGALLVPFLMRGSRRLRANSLMAIDYGG